MSEIRYDSLHDTHVLIAPERLHRPDMIPIQMINQEESVCPFCEGNELMTPKEIYAIRILDSLANGVGWKTRVVPNLYKAVAIEAPHSYHHGNFGYWDGFGAHEVIIDTSMHKTSMMQWDQQERCDWLKTLRQRVGDLRRDQRISYLSLFKNEGFDAGSTMAHCHTQLIGLPLIPKEIHLMNRYAVDYYKEHHHALIESIISYEEESLVRMVETHGAFSAFCPYASSYPFEVMISSKYHVGQIDTLNESDLDDLATLLGSVLLRLKSELNSFSFNLSISTPPLGEDISLYEAHRLRIRIMPRLYRLGGFEMSSHMMINPVLPELAAKLLRGEEYD
ncbi:MAG: UTP--glucose-1-phosphate uridylyltransferase [Sulfuricurvum sp.]|uniref:galactose-1-phosphate uridylyltransferase n=1 Tax=Sulfuricurvum sp. TaxID=2025608 RepID=UPI00262D6A0F|nr:UTP--glucose-1-phosphate uridylyltransferase [Sulfuricurvum sp.]MDD2829490.1 UTP--glucose-1-phosphate uridylyltransferase [Sulfuricurvum sp.]MDD4949513.1 UTP--glucose-1-phosphate uridylyltransferase [Sulfuricurvum sp.]